MSTDNKNTTEPKYLYHYMGTNLDHIKTVLIKNKLYFPSPKKFNDPFDCATTVTFSNAKEDVLQQYYHHLMKGEYKRKGINRTDEEIKKEAEYGIARGKHKNKEWLNARSYEIKKEVKEFGKKLRIFCLTKKPKDILMWSHYANNHKGIVLQFDRKRMVNENGENRCFPVSYAFSFPSIREYMNYVNSENYLDFANLFYCQKAKCWGYECEWRIFTQVKNKNDKKLIDIPDGLLTGIIFGCKTSNKVKEQIKAWNSSRKNLLTIYQAEPSSNSFEITITSKDGECL
jgi:hypothetical protein